MKSVRKIDKGILHIFTLFIFSGLLLTVIQPPFNLSFLAWVAYIPFILVATTSHESPFFAKATKGRRVTGHGIFLASYIVSLLYWLFNLYWVALVTIAGWLAFCAYTALLWPLLALAIRFCREKKIPLLLAVPVLIVGAENLQGFLLGGFLWRFLAHSQYANIPLIQIADIFGAAGVSFLIAMVNALLAELVLWTWPSLTGDYRQRNILTGKLLLKIVPVALAITAAFAYGMWRIGQTKEFVETGPVAGSVQTNIPQSVKQSDSPQANEEMFANLIKDSNSAIEAGCELVVWPETMVPAILDERVLRLLDPNSVYIDFDRRIREHSKGRAYILAGATGGSAKLQDDMTLSLASRQNSAFLYQPDGLQATSQYNKIHLVPFGEYVPFRKTFPPLYRLLMIFTPYNYDYSLDAGDEYTVFKISDPNGKEYHFSVMICYEDTVPDIARRFTINKAGSKQVHWLVNISNDLWFVKFSNNKPAPSTELAQHAAVCAFRAVENRLSILRSVNTGISCLIDSTGRIKNGFLKGNLPINAVERKGMAGWFVDNLPIDKRITFFSKYGRWLDLTCSFFFIMSILSIFLIKVKSRPVVSKVELKAKGRGKK
jgi:apolipoprotein N-acyltransferase